MTADWVNIQCEIIDHAKSLAGQRDDIGWTTEDLRDTLDLLDRFKDALYLDFATEGASFIRQHWAQGPASGAWTAERAGALKAADLIDPDFNDYSSW